ncbi:hypothetical protein AAGG74_14775 [Bacillus mexicanus]|uniref:hypothetical protein n=1 Tax=Bacillus mexicanus TaxID=2834415 RepID=UPI003D227A60
MLRKGVKIYKFINKMSALDVTHNLEYYKDKQEKDEKEYKGNIVISITSSNKYLKAYISKAKAKSLFRSFVDGSFSKLYPNGFQDYGGSVRDNQVIARILKIEMLVNDDNRNPGKKKVQIRFTISEGPGERTKTGAFKLKGNPTNFVQSYLDPISMRECALEVVDYINSAEIASQLIGRPLHTLTSISHESRNESGIQQFITGMKNGGSGGRGVQGIINEISEFRDDELIELYKAVHQEYKKRDAERNKD